MAWHGRCCIACCLNLVPLYVLIKAQGEAAEAVAALQAGETVYLNNKAHDHGCTACLLMGTGGGSRGGGRPAGR